MLCPRTAERMYDMYMIHAYWSQCQVLARPLPRASPICSSGISNGQCFTFWRGWGCGRWTGASKGSGQLKTQGTSGNSVDVDFILCSVCVYIWTCMNIYIYCIYICMYVYITRCILYMSMQICRHMRFHLPKWLKSWVVVREDDYIKRLFALNGLMNLELLVCALGLDGAMMTFSMVFCGFWDFCCYGCKML